MYANPLLCQDTHANTRQLHHDNVTCSVSSARSTQLIRQWTEAFALPKLHFANSVQTQP